MIITCPDCSTRYDVDDERFSPNGRSVRCSACGESWFVPAPELIDVEPLEEKSISRRKNNDEDEGRAPRSRMKVGLVEDDADRRGAEKRAARIQGRGGEEDEEERNFLGRRLRRAESLEDGEDDGDDSLFDAAPASRDGRRASDRDQRGEPLEQGWRKGRQFIVEDDEPESRRSFARKRNDRDAREEQRESLRFADEESNRRGAGYAGERVSGNRRRREEKVEEETDAYNGAYVVDADWEDVDETDGARGPGFGRRIRTERRRATALARVEDVRPFGPDALDDEFFASLRVTPRELERAIRKARRRAETREKNRLTPLRVIGWIAWLAVIAAAGYALFFYRDAIVKAAPKAADAYAVIGIEANPYGLAIEDVRHRLAMSTGGPTIEITGMLRNETDKKVTAPLLQAEALGPKGELLARWTFTASEELVEEGGSIEFVTRAPAPDGVAEVALSFAPEKSVLGGILPAKQ